MNILQFLDEPRLMGTAFQGDSRKAMRAVLAGAFGLPMDTDQRELFDELSGGREPPSERTKELWVIAGRRSEKTKTAAAVGLYLATVDAELSGLKKRLSPGERGVVSIVAVDRSQAKIAMNYTTGLVEDSPILSAMVTKQDRESIHFNNGCSIEVHTNSFRAVRGRTLLACILDESAFFRSDFSANPDVETYRAALPGLATTGGMLIGVSSPYARKGILYQQYRKHYGQNDNVLVVKGPSRLFNPTLPQSLIDDSLSADPEAARSEWLGEFRDDIAAFISREVVEDSTRTSPLELPYDRYTYTGFVDPAGGGQDEFTISIAHREGENIIIDLVRGLKGTPAAIVAEFVLILRNYRIRQVAGDRYGGSWPADEFEKHRIRYIPSAKPKSEIYIDALPLLNSGRITLPPDEKLLTQLCTLERRTARSGRDSIDHPVGAHDDRANSVCGAAVLASKPRCFVGVTNIRMGAY